MNDHLEHENDLLRVVQFFESMRHADVQKLDTIYTFDAYFKDPFNEVHSLEQIRDIFEDMFRRVDQPRFVIDNHILQDDQAFLTWRFFFSAKKLIKGMQCIRGASHLRFAKEGLVIYHRDYWDAAEELYEKLPLVGGLMRFMKRRAA